MRTDPITIRRGPIIAALIIIAILLGSALAGISAAFAQPAGEYTLCGAPATGKLRSTGETVRGQFSMMAVSPDGYWFWCQSWLKDGDHPTKPEPKPEAMCQAKDTYEEWTVGDLTCTSRPAGATTDQTITLRQGKPGDGQLVRVPPGGLGPNGFAIFRCTALPNGKAEWRYAGGICNR